MRKRAALSEVISTVILAGVVLIIGGSIWAYSLGAATVIADDYVNDTLELVIEVTERFTVEHVKYDSEENELTVWVFNYGEYAITVDTYLNYDIDSISYRDSSFNIQIPKGETVMIPITLSGEVSSHNNISIKVHSRRQNDVYENYFIP